MSHQTELTLSTEEKELMKLYVIEGLTVKEIAAKKGTSKRSIEKTIERIRLRLGCINVRQLIYRLTNGGVFSAAM